VKELTMIGWLSRRARSRHRTRTRLPSNRVRLRLESLEGRDCPSDSPTGAGLIVGPVPVSYSPGLTLTLTFDHWTQRNATVTGVVTGPNAAGATVTFSGALTGSVTADAHGAFTFTAQAGLLGPVHAVAVDSLAETSNDAVVALTNAPPVISNFTITPSSTGPNVWTFQCDIQDESPGGLPVTITGPNGSVVTVVPASSGGHLAWEVTLPPGLAGSFTVQTTDWWGAQSNTASCYVET
jgi:hypothetical protein